MQINKITNKILTNKYLLKTLEKISEHGTSFAAGTSLLLSVSLRPLSIYSTPDVKKENKFYVMSNSICSGLMKFAMVEAVALPIENAVKQIDQNSGKYLNTKLKPNSRSYKFITQIMKLSAGLIVAIPKSILTVALIPIVMDKLFLKTKEIPSIYGNLANKLSKKDEIKEKLQTEQSDNKSEISSNPSFKGLGREQLSKGIAKIINNKRVQQFAKKYQFSDEDIFKNMTALTDILLTSTSVYQTNKSKDIHETGKKTLIYNNIISTIVTLAGGYYLDDLVKTKSTKFIEKFKEINKGNPKLPKYIEGINIIRPALIFAGIYYIVLPIFSVYFADKIDRFIEKQKFVDNINLHKNINA